MPPTSRTSRAKREDYYRDRRRRKVCAFCADKPMTPTVTASSVNAPRRDIVTSDLMIDAPVVTKGIRS